MRIKTILLASGISWLALSSPSYATLKEAMEAMNDGDYSFAAEEFNRLIEKEKNGEALYQLAKMYDEGLGVKKDELKASQLFRQAAEQKNDKAALKLGNAFYLGEGEEKNYDEAFKWYSIAAEQGSYLAQYNVGLMYEDGSGVKSDKVKAFEFYKQSGNQGYAPAQIALGRMYLKGIGTPQDYSQSTLWFKLAADQGDVNAQMELAKLYANASVRGMPFNIVGAHTYFNLVAAYGPSPIREEAAELRDKITEKMRNEDVIAAQENANEWKKKTREESLPNEDISGLKGLLKKDETSKENPEEEEAIAISVQTGLQDLMIAAGISRRDLNKAVRTDDFSEIEAILKQKIEGKDDIATLALADLYTVGQGVKENYQEAVNLYKRLIKKNDPIAFSRLAPLYCEGKGVAPDLVECYKMMLLAKKFSDEASIASISETLQMLDENLDKDIREAGKKAADEWGEEKKGSKKGFGLFGKNSDDRKSSKKEKATEKKEEKKPEKKEKPADDDDDLFSGLDDD